MGAEGFVIYYGVRYLIPNEDEIAKLEDETHPMLRAAAQVGLQYWWGLTPEENCFLLIGTQVGNLGWEGVSHRMLTDDQFLSIMETTRIKLLEAEFTQEPALHAQFEPDF